MWFRSNPSSLSKLFCCVRCGASRYSTCANPERGNHAVWRTFVTPWGGLRSLVRNLPPCEGLPSSYDAPMGA